MNYDKQNNGHLAKPFTPTLSPAFNRANKTPITPKLANPSTIRTPKRLTPSDHSTSTVSSKPGLEPSHLNANVTPRSGSRSSRRDGSILSPGSTVSNVQYSPHSPLVQQSTPHVYRADRSPVRVGGRLEPSRTTRAKTLTADSNTLSRPQSSSELSSGSPMFFHASDARSVSSSSDPDPRPKPPVKSVTPTTFVYANGEQEQPAPVEETHKRRSFGLSRPVIAAKPPSASPRLRSPKLNESVSRLSDSIASQVESQIDCSPEATHSQLQGTPLNSILPKPIPIFRHMKSSSLDSGAGSSPKGETPKEGLKPSPIILSPSDLKIEASAVVPDPLPALRARVFSNGSAASLDSYDSASHSPVKSESAGNNGDVLNARTERKILDLEISNSSLLAINRTLEREMRKQNAELRRYRRLSRSGRLSMAPSARSVSGALSIPSELEEGVSELSAQSPEDLSDFSDEESVADDSVPGSTSGADDEAQQSLRDEKRFFIDLAKHQEVLADSQKMNQSLKRCLGWTEELIKEARKALEYNVQVNDIQLGGRVLSPEDLNDLGEAGQALLSPAIEAPEPIATSDAEPPPT